MKIQIETRVNNSLPEVRSRFNRELFEKLAPPFGTMRLDRFDGCAKGDEVHLTLSLAGMLPSRWVSVITENTEGPDFFSFVDEGKTLPPPLSFWRHNHRVEALPAGGCLVRDEITYATGSPVLDFLLRPFFYAMFWLRAPVYRRELGQPGSQ